VGDTLAGINTLVSPITDLAKQTVGQLGQAAGTVPATVNGVVNGVTATARTVGGIVSGAVPANGGSGGIFPSP